MHDALQPFEEEHVMPTRKLSTFEAFHRLVPSIAKRINEDPALAMRAMANPILAMEEIGVELEPDVAREVERKLRFNEEQRKKLGELEAELRKTAGPHFDPDSAHQIEKLLFTTLGLARPGDLPSLELPHVKAPRPVRLSLRRGEKSPDKPKAKARFGLSIAERPADPLKRLEGAHPVVDLLLAYRAITGKKPKLASRHDYELLKAKPNAFPFSKITIRLPEHVGPTEDDHA